MTGHGVGRQRFQQLQVPGTAKYGSVTLAKAKNSSE